MDKCICSLREEDYMVTPNPDCPVHGGLHGKNPYAAIEDKPKCPECGTEMVAVRPTWYGDIELVCRLGCEQGG